MTFDIPHAVIYLGYDFGKGWTFGTELEYEHGGTGIAYEKEDEEADIANKYGAALRLDNYSIPGHSS